MKKSSKLNKLNYVHALYISVNDDEIIIIIIYRDIYVRISQPVNLLSIVILQKLHQT